MRHYIITWKFTDDEGNRCVRVEFFDRTEKMLDRRARLFNKGIIHEVEETMANSIDEYLEMKKRLRDEIY